ncbi:MAG TPA: hypothetical protein VN257_10575 [Actinotalea sp.]|nr:hypothetical protein [Actinotalea sp.]
MRDPRQDVDAPVSGAWTLWPVGVRVVVRRRLAEGGYSDVLGELLATDDEGVQVRTRHGDVRVAAAEIAVGKIVPPAPERRPRRDPGTH